MEYDYIIVGSGFFGSVCARELTDLGYKCLVLEKRGHIGGNCYTEMRDGINVQIYGAHIFHTSNKKVWSWINRFTSFNTYRHHVLANYKNEIFSLPFSMWTFNKLWGVNTPDEAKKIIKEQSTFFINPTNLEEQAINLVGKEIYKKLIEGYTHKQWMKHPKELPKQIIKRLPVRFTWDNNYFFDEYQGIPIGGYSEIFSKLLKGIEVKLNTDFFQYELPKHKKIIFTGPIDKFFNYKHGKLEYKTVKFEHSHLDTANFQGTSVINFTDYDVPHTRIIEHKHFEFADTNSTWITHEFPEKYVPDITDPYYPVNDEKNNKIFRMYKEESDESNQNVIFGGRLGEYKYYDMHQIIENALNLVDKIKCENNL